MRKISLRIIQQRNLTRKLNQLKRYAIIQSKVSELYEEGNQSKSKAQAYRKFVCIHYPISERTFWRIMGTNVEKEMQELETKIKQLSNK